jgi:hypothetical protein
MKISDVICGLIAVAGVVVAIWQVLIYMSLANTMAADSGTKHLAFAIGAGVIAIGSVVVYLRRHPHVEEEIHVTK